MFERFLLVWLTGLSVLGFYWPQWFPDAPDPFVVTSTVEKTGADGSTTMAIVRASRLPLPYLIALTMFAIGCLLPRDEFAQVLARWPSVLGGTAVQYTAMPLLGYMAGRLFGLDRAALIGVTMVGCVPGAMASNVLTMMARGNVSYSISLTTSATLLSPIAVPLGLYLTLGAKVSLDPWKVSLELLWQVVGPVLLGHWFCRRSDWLRGWVAVVGAPLANTTILWIIAVVVALNRGGLTQGSSALLAALATINGLGYFAGYLGGKLLRLPDAMRRALTLEVGMQNAGLGTVMVLTFFPDDPAAAIPTAIYTFGCMFTGTVLARCWAALPVSEPSLPEVPAG